MDVLNRKTTDSDRGYGYQVVDVDLGGGLVGDLPVVGAVPGSEDHAALGVLDDVTAVAGEDDLAGVAGAVLVDRVWDFEREYPVIGCGAATVSSVGSLRTTSASGGSGRSRRTAVTVVRWPVAACGAAVAWEPVRGARRDRDSRAVAVRRHHEREVITPRRLPASPAGRWHRRSDVVCPEFKIDEPRGLACPSARPTGGGDVAVEPGPGRPRRRGRSAGLVW